MPDAGEKPVTGAGCLLRTYWMLAGKALLVLLAIFIAQQKGLDFTYHDLLYWLVTGSVVAARFWDIHYLQGQTADGRPATPQQWRRYSLVLLSVAALFWGLSHGLARLHGN